MSTAPNKIHGYYMKISRNEFLGQKSMDVLKALNGNGQNLASNVPIYLASGIG